MHTITLKILNGYRASRTHPFNAVSLWCANSHASYITGLLLPGRTPLTNPCTLCCTWAIYTLHPRHGSSKIPLQSIIHWETFQNRERERLRVHRNRLGGVEGRENRVNNVLQQPVLIPPGVAETEPSKGGGGGGQDAYMHPRSRACTLVFIGSSCTHSRCSATILFLYWDSKNSRQRRACAIFSHCQLKRKRVGVEVGR